jgi:hypothetical protein
MTAKILITTPATAEQAAATLVSKHIKTNERNRLIQQMLGTVAYEPRLGGSGQSLRCKSSRCDNLALGGARKQLCPKHYASFLEKSNAAQALPVCTGANCNVHTKLTFEWLPMCQSCGDAEAAARNKAADVMSYDTAKRTALDNVETVHEMREWIKEYML